MPILKKLVTFQWHCMKMFYTFYPVHAKNVENRSKVSLTKVTPSPHWFTQNSQIPNGITGRFYKPMSPTLVTKQGK
jgi:hypothetical protein